MIKVELCWIKTYIRTIEFVECYKKYNLKYFTLDVPTSSRYMIYLAIAGHRHALKMLSSKH